MPRLEETMKPEIPRTDSIDELAHFWDTHDVTDYEDELREVPSFFVRSDVVQVSLTADEHEALRGHFSA